MKREAMIINIIIGLGVIVLALWMILGDHDDRFLGSEYYEIHEEIHLFDSADAVWDHDEERWVHPEPDPETEEYITLVEWDDDADLWVYYERDPETDELVAVAVWDRAEQEWVMARYDEEEEEYITEEQIAQQAPTPVQTWHRERKVSRADFREPNVHFSLSRTLGLWFAAICTLFVMSFLYRDNPFYKFTESLVVGVSAAYSMVLAFWTMVVPNLFGRLLPDFVQTHISPARDEDRNLWYLIVAMLGIMLLWRLAPQGGWISRWPLAFIIGVFAGIRLIAFLEANFAIQIQATILPLFVQDDAGFNFWFSLRNIVIVLGVMACLTYFFFSIEHKGVVGKTAKLGIYILMITFGAGFAYTVMGRITLLTQRIEYLFDDWLWLIN